MEATVAQGIGGRLAGVPIPTYQAMKRERSLRKRLATVMLRGGSARKYAQVTRKVAESCGTSGSSLSCESVEVRK